MGIVRVEIMTATPNPLEIISRAAGVCYGKNDANPRRAVACYNRGHLSVYEHAVASFEVEGVSRACLAQLTRHRLCSFCVESQRYNRYDLTGDDWFIIPPSFEHDQEYFRKCMQDYASHYNVCVAGGMKPEDARYLLPEATKTRLAMTTNARQLFHLLDMRLASDAQHEIRGLARAMVEALKDYEQSTEGVSGWVELLELYEGAERGGDRLG